MTSRISFTPESTAESEKKQALACVATSRPRVVFPVPGGPQKIIEWARPASIAARSGLPGPRMCSWPMNSSRVRGRMRSARGRAASAAESKSPVWEVTAIRPLASSRSGRRRDKSVYPPTPGSSLPSMTSTPAGA